MGKYKENEEVIDTKILWRKNSTWWPSMVTVTSTHLEIWTKYILSERSRILIFKPKVNSRLREIKKLIKLRIYASNITICTLLVKSNGNQQIKLKLMKLPYKFSVTLIQCDSWPEKWDIYCAVTSHLCHNQKMTLIISGIYCWKKKWYTTQRLIALYSNGIQVSNLYK